ncbi:MAG: hypothetical protein ACUVTD_01505 [Nitrososphaerales archaeon]
MMELKVKDNTFYVLEIGGEKRIYDTESSAIASLKTLVAEKKDVNPDNVNIFEVKMADRYWQANTISNSDKQRDSRADIPTVEKKLPHCGVKDVRR